MDCISLQRNDLSGLRYLRAPPAAVATSVPPGSRMFCSCSGIHLVSSKIRPQGACHFNTSYVERHNLSVRMTVRRFTRLTNAFSKKIENHFAAVALGYFAYNYIKIHRTLRMTPAMAAGVADRLWDVADLVAAWEAAEGRAEIAA